MRELNLGDSNNPPFDDNLRIEIENDNGIRFPDELIKLLKKWNGGYFSGPYEIRIDQPIEDSLKYYLSDGFWGVCSIPGFARGASYETCIESLISSANEWGLPAKVIPLEGDGHTWVALDYRDSTLSEPTIIFIESDDCKFHVLAKNFTDYINKLIPHDEVYDYDGNIIYGS